MRMYARNPVSGCRTHRRCCSHIMYASASADVTARSRGNRPEASVDICTTTQMLTSQAFTPRQGAGLGLRAGLREI